MGDVADRFVLVPGRRQSLSDQLYGQILEQITSGSLKEGERLPTEQQLSALFGVSRPVVRQALMRLRADGLVRVRQGAGSFVMSRPAARLTDFAESPDIAALLRCIEARLPLEGAAAKLAAERRTPEQFARIAAAHAAFAAEAGSGGMTAETDLAFHASIAAATGNEFFVALFDELAQALQRFMRLSLNLTRTGSPERARRVVGEHAAILQAIQAQDGDGAQVAMLFHIGGARRRMIDRSRDQ